MSSSRCPGILATGLVLAFALTGCHKAPQPTPEPTKEAVVEGPTLQVLAPVVQYRSHEEEPLDELQLGATVADVQAGANVVTGQGGHATLSWPGFLTVEQLADTDTLLGLTIANRRYVVMDQAMGTARYQLEGAGEPADLQVKAAFTYVSVDAGAADVIVSLVPGDQPVAWLAVLEGQAVVTRTAAVTDVLTIGSGQAAGFTESGPLPLALDIDGAAVRAWFADQAAGTEQAPIAAVALRCQVVEAADMHVGPDTASDVVGATLDQDEIVAVDARNQDASWLEVRPLSGRPGGWVPAEDLACTGPMAQAAVAEAAVPTPTATSTPRIAVVTATLPVIPTATPTATATGEAYKINFWADRETITAGECTVLRWETDNIQAVYYEGKGVVGNGSSEECPDSDTTYGLKVILRDGSTQTRTVKIKVKEPVATKVPPTNTSVPPSETPVPPTSEPTTSVPPTTEPTTETPPTTP